MTKRHKPGTLPPPRKSLWRKNCGDKPAAIARAAFHAHVPARAIRKVFGSAAHTVVPAWLGQGVLASTDRRKKLNPPNANHSIVLLSALWLNLRLLMSISLLTAMQEVPAKCNLKTWCKGRKYAVYCFENCTLEELNTGKCQELKIRCLKLSLYVFIYSVLVQWGKNAHKELDFFLSILKEGKFSHLTNSPRVK